MTTTLPTAKGTGPVVAVVASLAQFMVVLDTSIVNLALPSMRASLGLEGGTQEWVVNAYLLAFGSLLLLGGRAGDVFGHSRVFLAGITVFCTASLLGGLAHDGQTLVAARAVQGVGAALISPAPLALISLAYPDKAARTRAVAAWSATTTAALSCGVVIGGLLTHSLGWRWVMFVNVPLGVCIALAGIAFLPRSPGSGTHARRPLVDFRILRLPGVAGGNAAIVLAGALLTSSIYFISLFLQEVRGYDPLHTGIAMLPMTIAIPVASLLAPKLIRALGRRRTLCVGALAEAAGFAWQSRFAPQGSFVWDILGPGILIGLSIGVIGLPVTTIAMSHIPSTDTGFASALTGASRQIGGSFGVAVLSAVAAANATGSSPAATTHGYSIALLAGSVLALSLACLSWTLPPTESSRCSTISSSA
ncbi:MFS transporter [Streptomyces spongiae]|uniref:MFS transporter n=1 Tax=Streptomyces spongiae TaxID=565072 RepID=A0A5N8XLN5_9ACTN|nr:MFS transporter [Streptomyces spongiae]MPY60360.1 MFS transporter [Streptomyces spongiae]